MSKTVELLLQRRKVAPEEFRRSFDRENFRWEFFFKRHRIDLDNPRTYPIGLRDEQLYAHVMERILTGDLERKSKDDMLKYILPMLQAAFDKEYTERTEELKEIFNER
jgi:hypothetical protein